MKKQRDSDEKKEHLRDLYFLLELAEKDLSNAEAARAKRSINDDPQRLTEEVERHRARVEQCNIDIAKALGS